LEGGYKTKLHNNLLRMKKETINDLENIINKIIDSNNFYSITDFVSDQNYNYEYYRYLFKILISIEYNNMPIVYESPSTEYVIKSTHNLKELIENQGSLSNYFDAYNKQSNKERRKANTIKIIPIIISVVSFIAFVVFGIINFNLNNKISKLEKEIVKKDSIINQLKINN